MSNFETLENATYNWPWEKTGWGKYIPILLNDCPWLLLMDMQNANLTGNCRLLRIKGKSVPFVLKFILFNKTLLPIFAPAIISMSNIFAWIPFVLIIKN